MFKREGGTEMTDTTIEFTDRYGGRPPSWLRSCHGDCEAMGTVPVFMHVGESGPERSSVGDEDDPTLIGAWQRAHAQPHEEPCNGWHFVECLDCQGTARVSWLTTAARIPRWIVKGVRFMPQALDNRTYPPGWRWHQRLWLGIKCAWLYDLGWRR